MMKARLPVSGRVTQAARMAIHRMEMKVNHGFMGQF